MSVNTWKIMDKAIFQVYVFNYHALNVKRFTQLASLKNLTYK